MNQIKRQLKLNSDCQRKAAQNPFSFISLQRLLCRFIRSVLELNILLFIYIFVDKKFVTTKRRNIKTAEAALPHNSKISLCHWFLRSFLSLLPTSFFRRRIVKHNETFLLYHFSFIVSRILLCYLDSE